MLGSITPLCGLAYFDNGNRVRGQKDLDKFNVLQYHRQEKDD